MKHPLLALSLTLSLFIVNTFFNQKQKFLSYIAYFFLILGVLYLCSCEKAHATFLPNASFEIERIETCFSCKKLRPDEITYYQDKCKFHKENGERTYADAKIKCWYLPDLTDRQNARYCFTAAIALLSSGSPMSKVVTSTLTVLTQYGIDCLEEWEYINNKLYWSKYHYEMSEFYQEVLKNDN